jgi:CheY-like chemotaxis protein
MEQASARAQQPALPDAGDMNRSAEVEADRLVPALRAEPITEQYLDMGLNEADDDRHLIQQGDPVFLIIENDLAFARVLLDTVREKGYRGLVATLAASALALIAEFEVVAITLDIHLPDIEGWRILERLKNDLKSQHIPVIVISTEEARQNAFAQGAFGFMAKPVSSKDHLEDLLDFVQAHTRTAMHRILIIDNDQDNAARLTRLLENEACRCEMIKPDQLSELTGDNLCFVVDERMLKQLPSSIEPLLTRQSRFGYLPVISFSPSTAGGSERSLHELNESVLARRAFSEERLLDTAMRVMHVPLEKLTAEQQRQLTELNETDRSLHGKKVLVVDDDMRNIFALTSVLEEHGMNVLSVNNGRDAIKLLSDKHTVDLVLMDIMMPEMDGIETMRELRKNPKLKSLPIIAVTAKAMKGDREKCIEAGAWDYLAKPVDTTKMLAVLRAWLHR